MEAIKKLWFLWQNSGSSCTSESCFNLLKINQRGMSSEKKIFHASEQDLSKYEFFIQTFFFFFKWGCSPNICGCGSFWAPLPWAWATLGKTLAQGRRVRQAAEGGGHLHELVLPCCSQVSYAQAVKQFSLNWPKHGQFFLQIYRKEGTRNLSFRYSNLHFFIPPLSKSPYSIFISSSFTQPVYLLCVPCST